MGVRRPVLLFAAVVAGLLALALLGRATGDVPAPSPLPVNAQQMPQAPLDTRAPPPPERRARPEADPNEIVAVVATIPGADGTLGPSLRAQHGVWSLDWENRAIPQDGRDTTRRVLNGLGIDLIGVSNQLAAVHPQLGWFGLSTEVEWMDRDRNRGLEVDEKQRERVRQLAASILARSSHRGLEYEAISVLIWMEVEDAPAEERERVLLDQIIANYRSVPAVSHYLLHTYISSPRLELADHAFFAALTPGQFPTNADLFLRDALRRGDKPWTRFWWNHVENNVTLVPGVERSIGPLLAPNRDKLAGVVGALLGQARDWQDGLRTSAVVCATQQNPVAFETEIKFQDGEWRPTQGLSSSFASCVLREAIPLPDEGQRAHLTVVR